MLAQSRNGYMEKSKQVKEVMDDLKKSEAILLRMIRYGDEPTLEDLEKAQRLVAKSIRSLQDL